MNYLDKKLSLSKRKKLYKDEILNKKLNPIKNFNPDTFDPLEDNTEEYKLAKRNRVEPPDELPTMWMKPKEIMEWQMIWMYESKQDLYLLFAHKINNLRNIIISMEERITSLEKQIK